MAAALCFRQLATSRSAVLDSRVTHCIVAVSSSSSHPLPSLPTDGTSCVVVATSRAKPPAPSATEAITTTFSHGVFAPPGLLMLPVSSLRRGVHSVHETATRRLVTSAGLRSDKSSASPRDEDDIREAERDRRKERMIGKDTIVSDWPRPFEATFVSPYFRLETVTSADEVAAESSGEKTPAADGRGSSTPPRTRVIDPKDVVLEGPGDAADAAYWSIPPLNDIIDADVPITDAAGGIDAASTPHDAASAVASADARVTYTRAWAVGSGDHGGRKLTNVRPSATADDASLSASPSQPPVARHDENHNSYSLTTPNDDGTEPHRDGDDDEVAPGGGALSGASGDAVDGRVISKKQVRFINPEEAIALEVQRRMARNFQVGPYIGSKEKDRFKEGGESKALALRTRREIERVPQYTPPWEGAETSFRRLPPQVRLPNELFLRYTYPLTTGMAIEWKEAPCADLNALNIDDEPLPMKYGAWYPPGYDPTKPHPFMVVLADHRGTERDFEDFCAHFLERPAFMDGLQEQRFVVFSPCISVRHSQVFPMEAVVARFCDWVVANHQVEHGRVHLIGKGLGGYCALRTCVEHKEIALSCVAILGRMAAPFRPMDRPSEKVKNLNGTHVLMYVPGQMRKLDWVYKFKGLCDIAQTRPPCRAIHYAEVRDHQVYYAINPIEFWNYYRYFRQYNSLEKVVSESGYTWSRATGEPEPQTGTFPGGTERVKA